MECVRTNLGMIVPGVDRVCQNLYSRTGAFTLGVIECSLEADVIVYIFAQHVASGSCCIASQSLLHAKLVDSFTACLGVFGEFEEKLLEAVDKQDVDTLTLENLHELVLHRLLESVSATTGENIIHETKHSTFKGKFRLLGA